MVCMKPDLGGCTAYMNRKDQEISKCTCGDYIVRFIPLIIFDLAQYNTCIY